MSEESPRELTQSDKDLAVVQHHASILLTHFDTVQIFVTKHDEKAKKTICADAGAGNWYARYGQVKCWVAGQDGYTANFGLGDVKSGGDQ